MSCWRVLELSPFPGQTPIPQLLVKAEFHAGSYVVHLTDLANIWREELDLQGIVDRALLEQSPIEVSKQDAAQLALLLEHIKKSLDGSEDAACRLIRDKDGDILLHSVIALPEPLDVLTWEFHLTRRTSTALRNELILPLLVSSHIQVERIDSLVTLILEKDRAITRLVDQFESSGMDLAAPFPIIGNSKTVRKPVKRQQAANYVPALQPFREHAWRDSTEQLQTSDVSTFSLFQEALAQSTPHVPKELKSSEEDIEWWLQLSDSRDSPKLVMAKGKKRAQQSATVTSLPPDMGTTSDDETEDEFETHEHFHTRNRVKMQVPAADGDGLVANRASIDEEEAETTQDEDDDLDGPSKKSWSKQHGPERKAPLPSQSPAQSDDVDGIKRLPVGKRFIIGGKSNRTSERDSSTPPGDGHSGQAEDVHAPTALVSESANIEPQPNTTMKKTRRPFKIGGKTKHLSGRDDQEDNHLLDTMARARATPSPAIEPSSPPAPRALAQESSIAEDVHEETPEQKAERKRAELKRKNEEAARKQAQQQLKKKKRF